MKRAGTLLAVLAYALALAMDAGAQETRSNFTNNIDIFAIGAGKTEKETTKFTVMPLGYHFTALNFRRLNLLGMGLGWTVKSNSDKKSDPYENDVHEMNLLIPLICLQASDIHQNNEFGSLNIIYSRNLFKNGHAIFIGGSFSFYKNN